MFNLDAEESFYIGKNILDIRSESKNTPVSYLNPYFRGF